MMASYTAFGSGQYQGEPVEASGTAQPTVAEAVRQFVVTFRELPDWVEDRDGRIVWRGRHVLQPEVITCCSLMR